MRIPKVVVLAIALPLLIQATNARGDGSALKLHVHQKGRFEAMMPSSAVDSVVNGKELVDMKFISEALADNVSYRVRVQVISPIDLGDKLTKQMSQNYLAQARKAHTRASGNRLEKDIEFKQHGFDCAEFSYALKNGISIRHRIMFDGLRLYLASVAGSPQSIKAAAAESFLDSVGPKGANAKKAASPRKVSVAPQPVPSDMKRSSRKPVAGTMKRSPRKAAATIGYGLIVCGENDFALSEDATRFLDSLRVLETK